MPSLLAIGAGYAVRPLLGALAGAGWRIAATTRDPAKADDLAREGIAPRLWAPPEPLPGDVLAGADAVLVSVAPGGGPCPAAAAVPEGSIRSGTRVLYLSSSSVYGDHGGAWIDETAACVPGTERGRARLAAERRWSALAERTGATLSLCRLAGIYGPGRNAAESLVGGTRGARAGLARCVLKPGHVFNRIHRDDIAKGLGALIAAPAPPPVVNFADGHPSPPHVVIEHAAALLGVAPPPRVALADADLSPLARSFYAENKRLRNGRLTALVGALDHPSYREGLAAIVRRRPTPSPRSPCRPSPSPSPS